MKTKLSLKKWIISLLALLLALMTLLMGLMYAVDPFLQFRVRDGVYMLNPRYVNPGLIKNQDYDTLLIGSSMTQNFDMPMMAELLDAKPLKIALGGLSHQEAIALMQYADSVGKAERYYICIDQHSYTELESENSTPAYLMEDGLLPRLRYLVSFEAWFSFLPVDMGFMLLHRLGLSLPEKFRMACSVDDIGNWENDFTYGEEAVLSAYKAEYAVSELEDEGLYARMCMNMDMMLDAAAAVDGEVIFFFPPYSALYWRSVGAQAETLLEAKAYFIARAEALGLKVYDFQAEPLIAQLSNYKDATHYSGEINDYMLRCFADSSCLTRSADSGKNRQQLFSLVAELEEKYKDILE